MSHSKYIDLTSLFFLSNKEGEKMNNIKIILKSMKEIIITYILQYILILILCIIYTLLGHNNLNNFINTYCIFFLLIYYLITIIYLYNKNKIKESKIKPNIKTLYLTISVGISISLILNMIIFKLTNNIGTRTLPIPLAIISSGLIGPIYEEILFRYILYNRLNQYYNTNKSILISTSIFAIIHINPVQILYAFILGLIITIFYNKYKNIIIPIIIHISANTIVIFLSNYNIYILLLSLLVMILNILIITKNKLSTNLLN